MLELSPFMSLLTIVVTSDVIATVPPEPAKFCDAHGNIRAVESPSKAAEVELHQR